MDDHRSHMRKRILRLLAPLALVLLAEAAFQTGVWEPLARPQSHAGTSVRLKHALLDPDIPHIDFVTLGSSRPEYGIDHALLASDARMHGFVHADLRSPGSHWMTVGILTRWLARHHPEIRGGVIALSIQDFQSAGNGDYELGIVYPFHALSDIPWMAAHVPFEHDDIASWGTWSALVQWREDIRDFVSNPSKRFASLAWWKTNRPPARTLFGDPMPNGDMCAFGVDSPAACERVAVAGTSKAKRLVRQCAQISSSAANATALQAAMQQASLSESLERIRSLVQAQLHAVPWKLAPVVVLMPMPLSGPSTRSRPVCTPGLSGYCGPWRANPAFA